MSNSNGIISAPVSIKDVQEVLGETSNDLAPLCKSGKLNMWSKHKPVVLPKLFTDGDSEWYKGARDTDFYNGVNCCGIRKVGTNLGHFVTTPQTLQTFVFNMAASLTYIRPSGGTSSPYRLSDFDGYDHNTPKYDKTGNKPYSESTNIVLINDSGGVYATALCTYDYDGYGNMIGLKDLFNSSGDDLYLGLVIEAESNGNIPPGTRGTRTNPLSCCCIGDKIDATSNNTTGQTFMSSCTSPTYSYKLDAPSETEKYFSQQEWIKVTTCIVKKNGGNYYFFPIDYKWFEPKVAVDTVNYAYITNCKVAISVVKMADGSYWAYIAAHTDFSGNIVAPSSGNSLLSFSSNIQISPHQASVNVKEMVSSKLSDAGKYVSSKSINAYNISDWSASDPRKSVAMNFTYSGSGSIMLLFGFTLVSGVGETKFYKGVVTVTLPTTTGNPVKSETVSVV